MRCLRKWMGLCALWLCACGGKNPGTFVIVALEGTVAGAIDHIDLEVSLAGQNANVTVRRPGGGELILPTATSLQIGKGEGALGVTARARDAAGTLLAEAGTTGSVARGETITVTVHFGPGGDGGDAAVPDAALADASGPPLLDIAPAPGDFGTIDRGTSKMLTFTVENLGASATGTITTALGGAQFALGTDGCNGQVLVSRATCSITVTYQPPAAGTHSGLLAVSATPGGTASASLTGMARDPAVLAASPSPLDFGTVQLGQNSTATVNVSNPGGVATGQLTASVTGTHAAQFTLMTDGCSGAPLGAGSMCSVQVRFTPLAPAEAKTATLTVSGIPGGTLPIPLTGTSIPAGGLTLSAISYASPVAVGASATATVTVNNTGSASGVLSTSLGGTNAAEFSVVTPDSCTGQSLGAGGSCTLTLRFAPTLAGGKTASLAVNATPGGPASTSVSGAIGSAQLMVARNGGNGTGSVTSSPSGVSCGTACSATFMVSPVSLTATADPTSIFTGWTGGNCSGAGNCSVALNAATTTVTAAFALKRFDLTVSTSGAGRVTGPGIDCGSDCTDSYDHGTPVTLMAVPDASSDFAGWTGACSGMSTTCMVTMTMAQTVGATFMPKPVTHVLTVNRAPAGAGGTVTSSPAGIDCGLSCTSDTGTFNEGQMVVLTAAPSPNYIVSSWSGGGCTGNGPTCTVTMNADATVSVTFVVAYTFTVTIAGTGTGSVTSTPPGISCSSGTCSAQFLSGTSVTLTARPGGIDHFFTGWSGDCSGLAPTCQRTANAARTSTATFAAQPYNMVFVSYATVPGNRGSASAYDADCNSFATAVGINNTTNNGYVAWVSQSGNLATTRLGSARGFVRMDGKPVADSILTLTGANIIYYPISVNEKGGQGSTSNNGVFTGTTASGAAAADNCGNWQNTGSNVTHGLSYAGPVRWTESASSAPAACIVPGAIYCFGKTKNLALTPTPQSGKRIWASHAFTLGGGLAALQTACDTSKPAGVGATKPIVPNYNPIRAANTALTMGATYVRPDGMVVGTYAEINSANLQTGVWQWGQNGEYGLLTPWTGTSNLFGAPASLSATCNDWTSTSSSTSVYVGLTSILGVGWWQEPPSSNCGATNAVYCAEQ